ncbi:MAG: hypothetical protein ABI395_02370 [Sphingobium sp.]
MNKLEKIVLGLWMGTGVWTAMALTMTGLTSLIVFVLMMTIIGLPLALLLLQFPSAFLYFSASLPVYLLLRKKSRPVAAAISAVITLVVMTSIPMVANTKLAEEIAPIPRTDGGKPVSVSKDSVVAVLSNYAPSSLDTECEDDCQRLLFSGIASSVIRGHVSAMHNKSAELQRYWLGPAKGPCHPAPMTMARAMPQDVGNYIPVPLLQEKARDAYGDGKCFFTQKAQLEEADVILARDDYAFGKPGQRNLRQTDLRLMRLDRSQWIGVWTRSEDGFSQAMKQSYASSQKLAVPLLFDAPFVFDVYSPARWHTDGIIEVGHQPAYGLAVFIMNDTRVRGFTDANGNPISPQ